MLQRFLTFVFSRVRRRQERRAMQRLKKDPTFRKKHRNLEQEARELKRSIQKIDAFFDAGRTPQRKR